MSVKRGELLYFLKEYLETSKFPQDYCDNGLQVEGCETLSRLAFATTATWESIEFARQFGASALIVHHGLIWKNSGSNPIVGPHYNRLRSLIKHDINLMAYHLPLDAHLECGNAATLAGKLKLAAIVPFGSYKMMPLGVRGHFSSPMNPQDLVQKLTTMLGREIFHACPTSPSNISSLGIITGGASHEWTFAREENLDAYLTGELAEKDWHDGREAGLHMLAGGHAPTERFGIQALMDKVKQTFQVEVAFFDSPTPV
ncbi:MAG: Nif3-like dinuclear metal center hexameric protein [Bdellovibrionales bacterium GWA2_49_15]|nr:MAG: Nif3-like dinuclear metal center hexameric protein [Bdellovibrionales bacterium GWA2_49_15]HAZ12589.1 Nif3-like dinuclear metal center hexameric protein [Bdellovibrionales bacterium]